MNPFAQAGQQREGDAATVARQKCSESQSTSISPYEYLAAQLRVEEQREAACPIKQFALESCERQSGARGEKCFVIAEEEEESRLEFGEPCSTIRYQHASFHQQDAETSDILIKEWLISPEKPHRQRRTETSLPALRPKENACEQNYQPGSHFRFDTQRPCVMEVRHDGVARPVECRRGIRLTARGRRA